MLYSKHCLAFILMCACCGILSFRNITSTYQQANFSDTTYNSFDTTVNYYGNKYKLSLRIVDSTEGFAFETLNALFTITSVKNNKLITKDSIGSMMTNIEFEDYNNDGIKDILVYHAHGARANRFFYLYIADNKTKTFIRLNGFEKLPNTSIDKKNNIITSCALYGMIGYSFYRINNKHQLIKLGKTIETTPDPQDSTFEKEYKRIISKYKEKN